VIVIEHHLNLIAEADWIIELGPDAGENGGQVVYQGTPEGLLKKKPSTATAPYLKNVLLSKSE
jgi:excinuclease ABC subunit A